MPGSDLPSIGIARSQRWISSSGLVGFGRLIDGHFFSVSGCPLGPGEVGWGWMDQDVIFSVVRGASLVRGGGRGKWFTLSSKGEWSMVAWLHSCISCIDESWRGGEHHSFGGCIRRDLSE